jgi:hypothetical protein
LISSPLGGPKIVQEHRQSNAGPHKLLLNDWLRYRLVAFIYLLIEREHARRNVVIIGARGHRLRRLDSDLRWQFPVH